ncbi:MAG: DUF1592 domain-containing protein [Alphaproteobacteria bacterium]|nr:DUF1592 domain-containing protein [Alphaproteobacteria bacterium]
MVPTGRLQARPPGSPRRPPTRGGGATGWRAAARGALLAGCGAVLVACGSAPDPKDPDDGDTDPTVAPPVATSPTDLGLRLLTRAELDHAVQDLLGVELSPSAVLPEPVERGYATDVRAGSVDDSLVEGMLLAAEQVVGELGTARPRLTRTLELEALPGLEGELLTSSGAVEHTWIFRLDDYTLHVPLTLEEAGRWRFTFRLGFITNDGEAPLPSWEPFSLPLRFDGEEVGVLALPTFGTEGPPAVIELDVDAGPHVLTLRVAPSRTRLAIFDSLTVGPVAEAGGPLAAVDGCPVEPADRVVDCVWGVLRPLAARAWRRPVDADRRAALEALLLAEAQREGGPREVLAQGLRAVLASPEFWFVVEGGEGTVTDGRYHLSPGELATRLALLVWQSLPDDALLACAEQGALGVDDAGPCGLGPQLDRLLDDARALRLIDGFATAWLGLARLDALQPDAATFPEVDDALVASLREETRLVLEDVLLGDRPLGGLVVSDTTWVDPLLARHYGLPEPAGKGFERVPVDPAVRGGILRTGGLLLSTANPARVSDVRRGELVLTAFACDPPEPAPAMLPKVDAAPGEERQAIAVQTLSPGCASCHAKLNPWGFVLSAYDVAGRLDPAQAVALPEGEYETTFADAGELLTRLQQDDRAARCFTRHLTSWATGHALAGLDEAVLGAVEEGMLAGGVTLRAALHAVVRSEAFRTRPAELP